MERLLFLLALIAVISGFIFPIITGLIAFYILTDRYPWEQFKQDKRKVTCIHLMVICMLCIFIPQNFLLNLPLETRIWFILLPHIIGAIAAWWLYKKIRTF